MKTFILFCRVFSTLLALYATFMFLLSMALNKVADKLSDDMLFVGLLISFAIVAYNTSRIITAITEPTK